MSSIKKLRVLSSDTTAESNAESSAAPTYWRSLAELEQTPEFREFVEREFATPLEAEPPNSPGRRRFMQLMGASFSLAGLNACRWKEDKLLPMSRRPEGVTPGTTRLFATSMELDGVAVGLRATSYDGRPIKIDGNPLHGESGGAASAYHQASVLGLYDPDRSQNVMERGPGGRTQANYAKFASFAKDFVKELRSKRGEGLRVLAERSSSVALASMRMRWLGEFPLSKWTVYEPLAHDGARAGSVLAFGKPHRTQLALDRANVVLSLDADFIAPHFPAGLKNARDLIKNRVPDAGTLSRVYAIESAVSLLSGIADHRLALRAEQIKAIAAALDAEISSKAQQLPELGTAQARPNAAFLNDPKIGKFVAAVAKDLLANVGRSVVVAGQHQPAEVHALAHRLNVLLGNVGNTVTYTEDPTSTEESDIAGLSALVAEMAAGRVETLIILGGNPAYSAPADVPFAAELRKVKTSIHLSLYDDETSQGATWHLPRAHYLEAWGDGRAHDGTLCLAQPLIAPLYGGRSPVEVLSLLLGETAKGLDLVRGVHPSLGDERSWRRAVHDGVVRNTAFERVTPKLQPLPSIALSERELAGGAAANGQLEIVFRPCLKVYDGRFGNNAWLQELPEAVTKLTWDNAALLSAATATALGVENGDVLSLTLAGRSIELQAIVAPGHADGSISVALGYGQTQAGHVGGLASAKIEPVGANAYAIRATQSYAFGGGLSIANKGVGRRLATTEDLHAIKNPIDQAGTQERLPELVREATLKEFSEKPDFAQHVVHHPPLLSLWQPPVSYDGNKWGMSIDLNRCIGCSACVTACQAENNIPVVGQDNVARGREMLWLRIDRYYKGDANAPEIAYQPVPCQQCENAPCEQVCPVGATMHSQEGLNDMVYNRCIGTRYCSNNCPYKVRRFNYLNYNVDVIGVTPFTPTDDPKMKVKAMVFNPEVTVRSRGVMEKCTFCVQRIQNTKIVAKNTRRAIEDGEIKTACQQTCPTDAIVFGDLNDGKSEVTRLQKLPRSYAMLGELNNRPRVQYLARVKNPNPELA